MQVDLNIYNTVHWIEAFRHLSHDTTVIPMDHSFLRFMNQDGIFIHRKYTNQHILDQIKQQHTHSDSDSDSDSDTPVHFYEFSQD